MTIPRIAPYALPRCAELPANKAPWQPDPERALLLVHDMQQYFLDFFDASHSPVRDMLANVQRLRALCAERGVPVVYTAQPGDGTMESRGLLCDMWGPGILARPELADIARELAPRDGDRILYKHRYSAFHRTELLSLMQQAGRDQLWICGVYAHIGCMLTASDAFMYDVKPFLLADAVADFSRPHHDMALEFVAGRCGTVLETQALLAACGDASSASSELSDLDGLLRAQLAELDVNSAALSDADELTDAGLDSVRLLELSERLSEQGLTVSFMDMMEHVRFGELRSYLEQLRDEAI